jgi:hypothetical protein
MNMRFPAIGFLSLWLVFALSGVGFGQTQSGSSSQPVGAEGDVWGDLANEYKPGVIWWIPGSAMDEPNMTANLQQLAEAGFGGVSVVPIYGVQSDSRLGSSESRVAKVL